MKKTLILLLLLFTIGYSQLSLDSTATTSWKTTYATDGFYIKSLFVGNTSTSVEVTDTIWIGWSTKALNPTKYFADSLNTSDSTRYWGKRNSIPIAGGETFSITFNGSLMPKYVYYRGTKTIKFSLIMLP